LESSQIYDFAVIGGGIAGCSVASHLSAKASVCLLEMEGQHGYHSTGRSAAVFSEAYGNETVRALTRASRRFFYDPPPFFCSAGLVSQRSVLLIAQRGQEEGFAAYTRLSATPDYFHPISIAEACERHPLLKPENLACAAITPNAADIDVNELQQGFLKLLRSAGGEALAATKVLSLERVRDVWHIITNSGLLRAKVVVNASGAWAGEIGRLAGAQEIDLRPLRRTVLLVAPPQNSNPATWPMLLDAEDKFYLKPDAGKLLVSPVDEIPSEPCDAQPDELDIAIAIDRLESVTSLQVRRVLHKWAGLRSFVEDRSPVVGYDEMRPGFFWLAALGGFGIQTAPALGEIAAALALQMPLNDGLTKFGINASEFSPARLAAGKPQMHNSSYADQVAER
jgi:D-arginine dehydrogenase